MKKNEEDENGEISERREINFPNFRPFGLLPNLPKLVVEIPYQVEVKPKGFDIGGNLPFGPSFHIGFGEEE